MSCLDTLYLLKNCSDDNFDFSKSEDVTESVGGAALVVGGVAAYLAIISEVSILTNMGIHNMFDSISKKSYKKLLHKYYEAFIGKDKMPEFSEFTREKWTGDDMGEKALATLKKYGLGKEYAVVTYKYKDTPICSIHFEKDFGIDVGGSVISSLLSGDDSVLILKASKSAQYSIVKYEEYEDYLRASMAVDLNLVTPDVKLFLTKAKKEANAAMKKLKDNKVVKECVNLDRLCALMEEASKDEKKDEKSDKVKELEDRIEQIKKKETRGFISDEEADEQIDDIKSKLKSVKDKMDDKSDKKDEE